MILLVARQEIRYWLKSYVFYSFLIAIFLISFFASYSEGVTFIPGSEEVLRPSPYLVYGLYGYLSLFLLLLNSTFVASAALRDRQLNFAPLIQATPVRASEYFAGKLLGALTICFTIAVGICLGIGFGQAVNNLLSVSGWLAHLYGIVVILIPAIIISGCASFFVASWSGNVIAAFLFSAVLLMTYNFSLGLVGKLEYEKVLIFFDVFGLNDFLLSTKYWTLEEKNIKLFQPEPVLIVVRLIACVLVFLVSLLATRKLKFNSRSPKKDVNERKATLTNLSPHLIPIGKWHQLWIISRLHFKATFRNSVFIAIVTLATLNILTSLATFTEGYEMRVFPQPHLLATSIGSNLILFIYILLILFTGLLIWSEKDNQIDPIVTSTSGGQQVLWGKILVLIGLVAILELVVMVIAMTYHLTFQPITFHFTPYIVEFLWISLVKFLPFLSLFAIIQLRASNKFIGYLLAVLLLLFFKVGLAEFSFTQCLFRPGELPAYGYSEMNGYGPYTEEIIWYGTFWILTTLLLFSIAPVFEREASRRLSGSHFFKASVIRSASLILWFSVGFYIFYQTEIVNKTHTQQNLQRLAASYERQFSRFRNTEQPRVIKAKYNIDVNGKGGATVKGQLFLLNKSDRTIDTLFITLPQYFNSIILNQDLKELTAHPWFKIYQLDKPLLQCDTMKIEFSSTYHDPGLEKEVGSVNVLNNGTFFTNFESCPEIGYQPELELRDSIVRQESGLPKWVPKHNPKNNQFTNNADWVEVETEFTTSQDQRAIAPGDLLEQKSIGQQNYFRFKTSGKILNTYAFISGNYSVKSRNVGNVNLQVYYQNNHSKNIDRMLNAMEKSLKTYQQNYGPYALPYCRIVEFPSYRFFASSFSGVIPYSEGVGFGADMDRSPIDMITYVVSHEMAHQWWGHQVAPADSAGAFLLTESLAQLAAITSFESVYGAGKTAEILAVEEDKYLRERARLSDESPIAFTQSQHSLVYYQKAVIQMARLRKLIGEDSLGSALKTFYEVYHHSTQYPTSQRLIELVLKRTPENDRQEVANMLFQSANINLKLTKAETHNSTTPELLLVVEQDNNMPTTFEVSSFDSSGEPIETLKARIDSKHQEIILHCKKIPFRIVLDPFHLLIDDNRANNTWLITTHD